MTFTHVWSLIIVAIIAGGCQRADVATELDGRTMGTTWALRANDCALPDCREALGRLIDQRLAELNAVFSHYDPASEVSAFNRHSNTDWFAVSDELADVVALAQSISAASDGAFDITVAPAVDAWGFGAQAVTGSEPEQSEIEAAVLTTGYRKLNMRSDPPALRKNDPALRIDLSAIAKGYAVDQLAYLLEQEGIRNYLLEIGGELRVAGLRPDGRPWRIGIEPPDNTDGAQPRIEYIVTPRDQAVASSGDYRNFYVVNEKRLSHTIDPATARPVANGVAAVTVIAPSAAQADALATALMVLGADAGLALAEQQGTAAMLIERTAAGLQVRQSADFAAYLLSY